MVALVDQYLAHVAQARRLRLELAADYLVMAAWLAYLKSRLLLPEPPAGEEPSGQDMADALQWQLRRLEGHAGGGRAPDGPPAARQGHLLPRPARGRRRRAPRDWDVKLYDLLRAYGHQVRPKDADTYQIEPMQFFSVEEAAERLGRMLGIAIDWQTLEAFLPAGLTDPMPGGARRWPRPSSPACSSPRTARSSCGRPSASARSICVNVPSNDDGAPHA